MNFILDLIKGFKNIDTLNTPDKDALKQIAQEYANLLDFTWFKYSCLMNIMR